MSYIPSRIRFNKALDAVADLLVNAVRSVLTDPDSVEKVSRRWYIAALRELQNSISGPEVYEAETLCATMLLGMYEVNLSHSKTCT
jgi:hypothetical protein